MAASVPEALDMLDRSRSSASRLEAVRRTRLLDSPPEEAFDALTRLAASLLKVPASFIAVVDENRDFYKSQHGFPEPLASKRELTETTFCHHTLGRNEPLVISDTLADSRWSTVATVATLGVRAYVGLPLRVDGENIGSFCVIDMEPRAWSAAELDILTELANSASRELMLRAALRDAQAVVKSKESMVAAIAHDLRTPLQILQLNAAILQRTADPKQLQVTERMIAAVDAMQQMTDELLIDSAVVLAAGRTPRHVRVATLLADVADTMGVISRRAGVSIAVGPVPDRVEIFVDYPQMMRVFCNIVGNSIKFGAPGTAIAIRGDEIAGAVRLSVLDNGPGMSASEVSRAFESGFQGTEGFAHGRGAGLGLSLVRTLVERNGGTVELDSEPGRGTTVAITVPLIG